MSTELKRHIESESNLDTRAVSLTPDILKVLEETREWAMEELDAVWEYSRILRYKRHFVWADDPVVAYLDSIEEEIHKYSVGDLEKIKKIIVKPETVIIWDYELRRGNEADEPVKMNSGKIVTVEWNALFTYKSAESIAANQVDWFRLLTKNEFNEILGICSLWTDWEEETKYESVSAFLEIVLNLPFAWFYMEDWDEVNVNAHRSESIWVLKEPPPDNNPATSFNQLDWSKAIRIDLLTWTYEYDHVSEYCRMSVRLWRKVKQETNTIWTVDNPIRPQSGFWKFKPDII